MTPMIMQTREENHSPNVMNDFVQDSQWQEEQTQTDNPAKCVEQVLLHYMMEGDMMWSLFASAAKSYRFSSVLHPFPPMYKGQDNEEECIFALRDIISQMPKFSQKDLDSSNGLSEECHQLLSWLLQKSKFHLGLQDTKECFGYIRALTGQVMDAPEPAFVFEVTHDSNKENEFQARRGSRKVFYAYHGSRFDNFYSILMNGLNIHLNKVAAFGEGTYLSSELVVSLLYSQAGETWAKSSIGTKLACVAVCEMIDDPSVKCQVKDVSASVKRHRAQASRLTDAVPEKYYVVQNNDVIRVKYLLVYKEEYAPPKSARDPSSFGWLREHKFSLLMIAYIVLLMAIGLANSRQASQVINRFFNQFRNS